MTDFNIRNDLFGKGVSNVESAGQKVADKINSSDEMDQLTLIELQQEMSNYNNMLSLITTMLKGLSDTDKEIIRNV